MFLKMHRGVEFDDEYLFRHGLDGYLKIPMSIESFKIPEELAVSLSRTITNFKGIKTNPEQGQRKYIEEFIAELKKNAEILNQYVSKDVLVAKAFE